MRNNLIMDDYEFQLDFYAWNVWWVIEWSRLQFKK